MHSNDRNNYNTISLGLLLDRGRYIAYEESIPNGIREVDGLDNLLTIVEMLKILSTEG